MIKSSILKTMLVVLVGAWVADAVANEATFSDITVKQRWPWSRLVDITYVLSNATNPVNVIVTGYNGDRMLNVLPEPSLSGEVYGVTNGAHRMVWDPTKTAYSNAWETANAGILSKFSASLSSTPSQTFILSDTFTTNSTTRLSGSTLHNTLTEVGGGTWVGQGSTGNGSWRGDFYYGSGASTGRIYGANNSCPQLGVNLPSIFQTNGHAIVTLSWDVDAYYPTASGGNYAGIGFLRSSDNQPWNGSISAWYVASPIWASLSNTGVWKVGAKGTNYVLATGSGIPISTTTFHTMALSYDRYNNAVKFALDGTIMMDWKSLNNYSYVPLVSAINRAAIYTPAGTGNGTSMLFDNFSILTLW